MLRYFRIQPTLIIGCIFLFWNTASFACLNPNCEFNFLDNPDINLEESINLTKLAFERNNMGMNSYCMEIKWVADYSYYSIYGNNVSTQIATILNGVESIFNNSGISLTIKNEGSLNIYTSTSSDPYSNPASLPCHPGYAQGCVSIARVLYEFDVANTQYLCTGMSRAIGLSHHKTTGASLSNTVRSAIMAHELIHIIRQDGVHHETGASLMSPAGPNNGWTSIRNADKTVINQTISSYGCFSCSTATCNDGIQNQGELGQDCGGPCPNACPTCNDGIQNQGELGQDCGGPCPNVCLPGDCTHIDGTYSGTYSGTATYKAPNYMIMSYPNNQAVITSGANIEMSGGQHVDLTPGFRAIEKTCQFTLQVLHFLMPLIYKKAIVHRE